MSMALIVTMLSLGDTLSTSFYNWAGTYGGLAKATTIVCDAHPNGSTSTVPYPARWLTSSISGWLSSASLNCSTPRYVTIDSARVAFCIRTSAVGSLPGTTSPPDAWEEPASAGVAASASESTTGHRRLIAVALRRHAPFG